MNVLQAIAVGLGILWACTAAFFVGIWVACLVMERRLRRWDIIDTITEAEAILEVTEKVRATTPPLAPEFLADLVNEHCKSQRSL